MPCGNCKQDGHNRRTCPLFPQVDKLRDKKKVVPDFAPLFEKVDFLKESVEKKPQNLDKHECIICYETIGVGGFVMTACEHVYCVGCFARHIRLKNDCAYCRQEISIPIEKKTIAADERSKLVEDTLLNDYTFSLIYSDFYTQIINNVNKSGLSTKKNGVVKDTCINLLKSISLDYCIWFAGIKVCEAVCHEYENNL